MKLNKKQKLHAYTYAMFVELNEIDERSKYPQCVCESLGNYSHGDMQRIHFADGYNLSCFPEFFKQKPIDKGAYSIWWPVYSPLRLKAIEAAIALTEQL